MIDRLFNVLYLLAVLWAAFIAVLIFQLGVRGDGIEKALILSVVIAPSIIFALLSYIVRGRLY